MSLFGCGWFGGLIVVRWLVCLAMVVWLVVVISWSVLVLVGCLVLVRWVSVIGLRFVSCYWLVGRFD